MVLNPAAWDCCGLDCVLTVLLFYLENIQSFLTNFAKNVNFVYTYLL